MANNFLITGYWGEPHITPENDRGINAAIFGAGRYVLPVGEKLKAEYIGNNTIRIYDGKLIDNGAVAGIPAGEYVDLLIPEAGQGMKRKDLIVFQYKKDESTLIECGEFIVVPGTETSETPTEPMLIQQDILSDKATLDQMALYSVSIAGAEISSPVAVFDLEYQNPPMQPGVEYRTTKRHNGQPVYTKLIDFGTLTNADVSAVYIGTSSIVSFYGITKMIAVEDSNALYHDPFPIHGTDGTLYAIAYTRNENLVVKCYDDLTDYTAQFIIEYTK